MTRHVHFDRRGGKGPLTLLDHAQAWMMTVMLEQVGPPPAAGTSRKLDLEPAVRAWAKPGSRWDSYPPVAIATLPGHDGPAPVDPCTTADCENPASRLIAIEDTGAHAYCAACAEVLLRGGHREAWL